MANYVKIIPQKNQFNESSKDDKLLMITTTAPDSASDNAEAIEALGSLGILTCNPNSSIIVDPSGTDTQRGTALVAAYAAAKLLTPGGLALSATNRASVVIPPGNYKLSSTLVLDADFVDLIALVPTKPARRSATTIDSGADGDYSAFTPQNTLIYYDGFRQSTVNQTADDVRMHGFSIAQTRIMDAGEFFTYYIGYEDWGALLIGNGSSNIKSIYSDMYFWTASVSFAGFGGVRAYRDFSGTWINCCSNSASFRLGWGDLSENQTAVFSATMIDCEAGPYSYAGDYPNESSKPNYTVENALFIRCKSVGFSWETADAGMASFAGCNGVGSIVKSSVKFIECESGPKSFGLGATNEGTYIRCRGGFLSFGATFALDYPGNFAGYAEDCVAGADSFGGTISAGYGKLTGTLLRCTGTGNTVSMRLEGATIRDSRITVADTGIHALTLLDSNSVISNSDIIVKQGGTGIPIYAATAKNVAAYDCRMNNASNDADGLHANVTNLVTTPYNVVSNSVK